MKIKTKKEKMIQAILIACKANEVANPEKGTITKGEVFFGLAFASEKALIKICQELYIPIPKN